MSALTLARRGVATNEDPIFGLPLPAAAGVWLSANSSALHLPRARAAILDAEAGLRAENSKSLEFARVPEGLRVEACAPDFDLFRREGRLACNENTIVVINTESDSRACPGTLQHTLLDCMKPLQFDAAIETLVWRPPTEKMHFGTRTWNDVCALELILPALVREMCTLLSEYTLQLPVAAAIGRQVCYGMISCQDMGVTRKNLNLRRRFYQHVLLQTKFSRAPV